MFHLQRYLHSQSSAMMLDVTGTVIHANTDPTVLEKINFFYSDFMHMAACSFYYDHFPKIRLKKIAIYRLAYSIAIYCKLLNRNPCIMIRIISPDSCQYTALFSTVFWLRASSFTSVVQDNTSLDMRFTENFLEISAHALKPRHST